MAGLRLLLIDEYGNMRTLSDNVHIGADEPTNPDIQIWIDNTTNPPTIKYRSGDKFVSTGPQGAAIVDSTKDIPTTSKLVIANVSKDEALTVGNMAPGQELHIILNGTGTITLPTGAEYVNMSDDTISVDGYAEVNIISDGSKKYIRSI